MKLEKEVMIINGYNSLNSSGIDFMDKFTEEELDFLKKENFRKIKLTLETKEPILDEEERKYLSGVIRPFRDEIKNISKTLFDDEKEFIIIRFKDNDSTTLKNFEKGTMYKNMELNKEYTIKELGL